LAQEGARRDGVLCCYSSATTALFYPQLEMHSMKAAVCCIALLSASCSGLLLSAPKGNVSVAKAPHGQFMDRTALGAQVHQLAEVLGAVAKVADPVPQPSTVPYSPHTCKTLFAYEETRDACFRLQPLLCGKNCSAILPNGTNVTGCVDTQKEICQIEKFAPAPKHANFTTANGTANHSTTFCHAYPTLVEISIQHDKYFAVPDPEPFLKGLKYLECRQAKSPRGRQ